MKYQIKVNKLENPTGNVMGYASVVFEESLKVARIAIVKNKSGGLFVSMPHYATSNPNEEYKDICNPITKEFRAELYDGILSVYENMDQMEEATKTFGNQETELKIEVRATTLEKSDSKVKGLARMYINDCFVINNISLIEGKNGLFVSMPSYKTNQKDAQGKAIYQDLVYPVTKEFREKMIGEIKSAYEQVKEQKSRKIKETIAQDREMEKIAKEETPFR